MNTINRMTVPDMIAMYRDGYTYREIGEKARLSKQRIHQLLSKHGISRNDGGASMGPWNRANRQKYLNEQCLNKWGLTRDERKAIHKSFGKSPFRKYKSHRMNSKRRGIQFKLTFKQWWNVWQSSGKWPLRRQGGFCMARNKDQGAYEIGNVHICTVADNIHEYWDAQRGYFRISSSGVGPV